MDLWIPERDFALPEGDEITVDSETTGLRPHAGDAAFAWSFCNEDAETGYVEWPVDPFTRRPQPPASHIKRLRQWAKKKRRYIFHNAAFDVAMARELEIFFNGPIEDTAIGMHTAFTCEYTYALKKLAKKYCDENTDDEQELQKLTIAARRRGKKLDWKLGPKVQTDYWMCRAIDPEDRTCKRYAVRDTERTMLLWILIKSILNEEGRGDRWGAYRFEMDRVFPVLGRCMQRGLRCDRKVINEQIKICAKKRDALGAELREMAGWDFDPGSDSQTRRFLFEGEPFQKEARLSTKKGQPSASQDSLEAIANEPEVASLLEWRQWAQGISSFFIPYREALVETDDGCTVIYPNFKQHGKKTRRLSVTDPNLQGSADDQGGRGASEVPARKPFGPRPGHVWVLIDYNQLEVRTFAACSRYERLIEILNSGEDLHTDATNGIWGGRNNPRAIKAAMDALKTDNRVQAEHWLRSFDYDIVQAEASVNLKTCRSKGKPFFFTRMFGGGARSISFKLHCMKKEAQELVNAYDRRLPGVIGFVKRADREAKARGGWVETVYGRPLDLPVFNGRPDTYKASPYMVQGTAADLVKAAMVRCDDFLESLNLPTGGLLLQIHDELIFELPEDLPDLHGVIRRLKQIMEEESFNLNPDDTPDELWIDTPTKVKIVYDDGNWSRPHDWKYGMEKPESEGKAISTVDEEGTEASAKNNTLRRGNFLN